METPRKIAGALKRVKSVADRHKANIIRSTEISRADRELLLRNHWLQEIIKGWYLLTRPDLASGDTAAWYANFWDFLRIYLHERYGKDYCLSAETSLELQIGESLIPQQVIVIARQGGSMQQLPFETSILVYSDPRNLPEEREEINGLQVMPLPLALCKISPTYYQKCAENAEIALRSIRASADITRVILKNEFQRAAERIIGAYQFFGLHEKSEEIKNDLARAGMLITPNNPFAQNSPYLNLEEFRSPYAARIEVLWNKYREDIIKIFPAAPGLPKKSSEYLEKISALYEYDAYNSLSIEGYQVTPDLIQRVQQNKWEPSLNPEEANERNALAARGYYEAFLSVKKSVEKILEGKSPGECVAKDLSTWYQNLFSPSVRAGIIPPSAIVGYRNDRVFIRNSRHSPPPKEAVLDSMESFFKCLKAEPEASVRAVLGHYIFVFIHPYMDGNGRTARFILNAMLASGGYPWTVVELKRRSEYINALECVHTENNIKLFTQLILKEMKISEAYTTP